MASDPGPVHLAVGGVPVDRRDGRSSRFGRIVELSDSPWVPAGIVALACTAFVLARLVGAAHGNISAFALVGTLFADHAQVPHGLVVSPGSGYDGQFYYRMALDPWNLTPHAYGITIDSPLRLQRIGYPLLVWLVSLGNVRVVPYALVVVNVVAMGCAGLFSGQWARSLGRHAFWGILPAGYFGLVWSVGRDLTEPTAIALTIGGIVAYRRRRPWLAASAFTGAVLCRETALLVVVALLVTRCIEFVRREGSPGREDGQWAMPLLVLAAWEIYCDARYGSVPLVSGSGNAGAPFVALVRALSSWVEHPHRAEVLQLVQTVALALVIVLAVWHIRRTRSSRFEQLAFIFAVVLVVCLSSSVWDNDPNEFRTMTEAFVLGAGILLGSARIRPVVAATAVTWAVWLVVGLNQVIHL